MDVILRWSVGIHVGAALGALVSMPVLFLAAKGTRFHIALGKVEVVLATLVLLAGGWVVMEMNWPVRLPQQVLRFTPERLAQPLKFAQASTRKALYNVDADTVVLEGSATNIGSQPMRVVSLNTANMTFEQGKQLVADPAVVQPGQTVAIKMTIKDEAWREQRLLPLGRSEMGIGGLLIFESGGVRNAITIEAPVTPNKFTY